MGFGGYEPPTGGGPNGVRMDIPADMVDAVNALIADPEAFVNAVQRGETSVALVDVAEGTWINPRHIMALERTPMGTRIYLNGARIHVEQRAADVIARLQAILSDPDATVSGNPNEEDTCP